MSDESIPRGDADAEVAWFVQHHARALQAARAITRLHFVLDGAQTVAQGSSEGRFAALALKYEVDAGVHNDLRAFRTDCLSDVDVTKTARLGALRAMLAVTQDFIAENLSTLINIRQASVASLDDLCIRLRTTLELLDSIIDDCVGDLAARPITPG